MTKSSIKTNRYIVLRVQLFKNSHFQISIQNIFYFYTSKFNHDQNINNIYEQYLHKSTRFKIFYFDYFEANFDAHLLLRRTHTKLKQTVIGQERSD